MTPARTSLLLMLALSARLAFAGADWGFRQIVGYVDLAEQRFKEGDAESARTNLTSARDMIPEASAAAKSDKGWPELERRMARLDQILVQKAARASQMAAAGQGAEDTEQGKAALTGYALATQAVAAKKLEALALADAIRGAEACARNTSYLTRMYLRSGKQAYPGASSKLGERTIDDLNARCTKLVKALQARPAFGCGRRGVSVSQDRASIYDRWNAVEGPRPGLAYEAMDCKDMPRRSSFPGASASFKATYVAGCGGDATYVIQHDRWLESPTQRHMSGECWKKGTLRFSR